MIQFSTKSFSKMQILAIITLVDLRTHLVLIINSSIECNNNHIIFINAIEDIRVQWLILSYLSISC